MPKDTKALSVPAQIDKADSVIQRLRDMANNTSLTPLQAVVDLKLDLYSEAAVWGMVRRRLGARGIDADMIPAKMFPWHDRKFASENSLQWVPLRSARSTSVPVLVNLQKQGQDSTLPIAARQASRRAAAILQAKANKRLDEFTLDELQQIVGDLAEAYADLAEHAARTERRSDAILRLTQDRRDDDPDAVPADNDDQPRKRH